MKKTLGLLTLVFLLCVTAQSQAVVQPAPVVLMTHDTNLPYTASVGGGVGVPTSLTIASAITTNTSTTPVAGVSGTKNFQWKVTGTGAVTQTVVLNGSFDSDGSSATDLCTITLSGTAPVYDVCAPFTAPFPYLFVTTTNTTGTGASGTGKVGY